MSAFGGKADIRYRDQHVRFVPKADIMQRPGRYKVRDAFPCYGASGRCGMDDLPILYKHPDFEANAAVPIDSDVRRARA